MSHFYTDEKNALYLIALLKAHGIRKIVANPGTTNIAFVGSVQNDPWFQVYSGVDERHSSYLACGMAAESGEPVVLSCTGATASRNYISALTEAYYRKLPILAITSLHSFDEVGNLLPQMMDRRTQMADVVRFSLQCPVPHTPKAEKRCVSNLNKAILELSRHGGGPVHINLETEDVTTFNTRELPQVRVIHRKSLSRGEWPRIKDCSKVVVWVGAHPKFSKEQTSAIEQFIDTHQAIVAVDHTSGYSGRGAVHTSLLSAQPGRRERFPDLCADICIQIGEISGDYYSFDVAYAAKEIWRVSEDGEARDLCNKLTNVFEMPEDEFFRHYAESQVENSYLARWLDADRQVRDMIPELPFSNCWIANELHDKLPANCALHFGILNSLRSWNFQSLPRGVTGNCNVGGFGIDGCVSALIGASMVNPHKLYFGFIGDLSFFYDLNSLGNRHIGNNLRILLVNNGCGAEFNLYSHFGSQFGERTNDYIAAGGHNGNRSRDLVKHYVSDLGFEYLAAESKEQFNQVVTKFINPNITAPIVLECFTDKKDESDALETIRNIVPVSETLKSRIKAMIPVGVKGVIKGILQ